MPSYRVQLEIMGLRPGHRPEEVMDTAVAAVAENFHVDARQIDVIAGTPRVTVRYTVPDSSDEEERELALMARDAALEAVNEVAVVGRSWALLRRGGRWLPAE